MRIPLGLAEDIFHGLRCSSLSITTNAHLRFRDREVRNKVAITMFIQSSFGRFLYYTYKSTS